MTVSSYREIPAVRRRQSAVFLFFICLFALQIFSHPATAHNLPFVGRITLEPAVPSPGQKTHFTLLIDDPLDNPVIADDVLISFNSSDGHYWQRLQPVTPGHYAATVQLPPEAGAAKVWTLVHIGSQQWRGALDLQIGRSGPPIYNVAFVLDHLEPAPVTPWHLVVFTLLFLLVGWLVWRLLRQRPAGEEA